VSAVTSEPTGPVLCLGEALVDLICERHVATVGEADAFVPHFGGVVANVALLAARGGARVSLVGATGDDAWGAWLADQLAGAGVDLSWFRLVEGAGTPLALVTVDPVGEAAYRIYGEPAGWITQVVGGHVDELAEACGALFVSSNTLVGPEDRELTMGLRERALELDRPVIFDPNLRLHRWRSRTDAAASANACVPGALLVRANRAEATLMTREEDPERAAQALLKAGAHNVVISLDEAGAIARGRFRADVPCVPMQGRLLSTVGAGDALTATLITRLALTGWYEPAIAAGLPDALTEAARACERWGAID
jgi:sugar/nucleoside kinase (ribokinase family)